LVLALLISLTITVAEAGEWSGYVAVEARQFIDDPLYAGQQRNNQSLAFAPEFYQQWQRGRFSLTFSPFVRQDSSDDQRSHADVRELLWLMVGDGWELRAGLGRLFWGVTESQHLVDIVNQTDLVEDLDGEQKLGQPLIDLSLIRDWGTLDLLLLPGFRERSFPGPDGRLRSEPYVAVDQAGYEAAAGQQHIDVALRWFRSIDDWDVGLSVFDGTARAPLFSAGLNGAGQPVLVPYYEQIRQVGLDLQLTREGWLWKLEAIQRNSRSGNYRALTGGAEYTLYALMDSDIDVGLIAEYLYDSRKAMATTPFEDDLMLGLRFVWNNTQSTELLAGVITDIDTSARALNIEASTRIGASWKLSGRARGFAGLDSADLYYPLRNDGYVQVELARYF
jgi:hypothetical protein